MTERRFYQSELWLCINEDGFVTADILAEDAAARMSDEYGGLQRRMVRLILDIPVPERTEITVEVPKETGAITAEIAADTGTPHA